MSFVLFVIVVMYICIMFWFGFFLNDSLKLWDTFITWWHRHEIAEKFVTNGEFNQAEFEDEYNYLRNGGWSERKRWARQDRTKAKRDAKKKAKREKFLRSVDPTNKEMK